MVSAIHHMVNHSSYSTRSLRGMAHNTSIVISDPYLNLLICTRLNTSDRKDYFFNIALIFAASFVGGWHAVPVQRKTTGASFVGNVLANGSTGPVFPCTTLFG